MTAELGFEIIHALTQYNKGQEGRDALELFFGGSMPLPEPGTSAKAIYSYFVQLRAHACCSENYHDIIGSDQGLQSKLQLGSPAMLARLVCCRAEAATLLREPCERQWWKTAMGLYDAYLSNEEPKSKLDRICIFDLYRYRDT